MHLDEYHAKTFSINMNWKAIDSVYGKWQRVFLVLLFILLRKLYRLAKQAGLKLIHGYRQRLLRSE